MHFSANRLGQDVGYFGFWGCLGDFSQLGTSRSSGSDPNSQHSPTSPRFQNLGPNRFRRETHLQNMCFATQVFGDPQIPQIPTSSTELLGDLQHPRTSPNYQHSLNTPKSHNPESWAQAIKITTHLRKICFATQVLVNSPNGSTYPTTRNRNKSHKPKTMPPSTSPWQNILGTCMFRMLVKHMFLFEQTARFPRIKGATKLGPTATLVVLMMLPILA